MTSPFRPKKSDATGAPLVRAGDPPGLVTSLRTLARAMLALSDQEPGSADGARTTNEDRRGWGGLARAIHRERLRRAAFFPDGIFGEPAWDILLDLFAAAKANELRSIKAVCLSSQAPEATALRYIDVLADYGLVERRQDKTDRRRKFLSLTQAGERAMQDYLSSMPPMGDQGKDLIRYLTLES